VAKKNFIRGIDAILGGPVSGIKQRESLTSIEGGKKEQEEERTSVILKSSLLEKLRAIAYWERSTLKIEIKNAIEHYLNMKDPSIVDQALERFREKNPVKK